MPWNHFLKDTPGGSEVDAGRHPEPSWNGKKALLRLDGQSVMTWPLQSAPQYAITPLLQCDRTLKSMRSIVALLSVALFSYSRPGSRKLLHLLVSMRAWWQLCFSQAAVKAAEEWGSRRHPCDDTFWHWHLTNVCLLSLCDPGKTWPWHFKHYLLHPVAFSEPPYYINTIYHLEFFPWCSSIFHFILIVYLMPPLHAHIHTHSSVSQPYRWSATIWLICAPTVILSPLFLNWRIASFTSFSSCFSSTRWKITCFFWRR